MDANREMKACSFAEWRADLGRSARKQGALALATPSCQPHPFAAWPHSRPCTPPYFPTPIAGIAIAAMYSAAPALERIRQEEEDAIVAAYASGEAA